MKRFQLPHIVCIILAILLVVGGTVWNNVAGVKNLRAKAMNKAAALQDILENRGADGMNLSVIAARHLPGDDEDLTGLIAAAKTLQSKEATLSEKQTASEVLNGCFARLQQKLANLEGFAETRDAAYLQMVQTALNTDSAEQAATLYNQQAIIYNNRLASPLDGLLSRLFGLKPCGLFL